MASKPTGTVTGLTRGGQIVHHYIKMLWEVATKLFSFVFGISLIVFASLMLILTTKYELFSFINYIQAWWVFDISNANKGNIFYISDWTSVQLIMAKGVYTNSSVIHYYDSFVGSLKLSLSLSFLCFSLCYIGAFFFLKWKGKDLNEEHHVRGSQLVDAAEAKEIIIDNFKRREIGDMRIGEIPILKGWENQSFLCIGGPGAGKSLLTADWIEVARKEGRKAFILDRSGGFIEKFYDPSRDIIINPYDRRSAKWNIFSECKADYHFSFITNTLIQKSDKEVPFWPLAARLVFKSLLMKEAVQETPSTASLLDKILSCSLEEMVGYCKGTDAASVFDEEGMKMAQSIRSVIASEVEILRVLDSDEDSFSIRDWVNNESEGFVFVSTLKDQEEALRPFITLLCDIFMNSVLSLRPNLERRVWAFLDELQALGKLNALGPYLSESRKYGGCCLAGFQGYSQAKRIYGDDGIEELSDMFATFIVLKCNGNKSAEWSSKQLGKADKIEVNESLSYGVNTARDGANLQNNRRESDVVLASELQNLEDKEGYVRLGRGIPVCSFKLEWKHRPDVAIPFDLDNELIRRQITMLKSNADSDTESTSCNSIFGSEESSLLDSKQSLDVVNEQDEANQIEQYDTFSQEQSSIQNEHDQLQLVDTFTDSGMER